MSSPYARTFTVPDGFPHLLKDFSREVLRMQPENIYEFGAQYFGGLLMERDGEPLRSADGSVARGVPSREEIEELIMAVFIDADADRSGTLDHREFKSVMATIADKWSLSNSDIRRIMAEADENDDGIIQYEEFVPLAVQLLESMYAKEGTTSDREARDRAARDASRDLLLHGMPREDVEALLIDAFRRADVDDSGSLSRSEFHRCLREADLGLTRREINALMSEVDVDGDGRVSYEEFIPLCLNVLVEIMADGFAFDAMPSETKELVFYFQDLFARYDDAGAGRLPHRVVTQALRDADLGLTRIQLHAIMSEAEQDDEGAVDYARFSQSVAGMVLSILDFRQQQRKSEHIHVVRRSRERELVAGMDQDTLENALLTQFMEADADGYGTLPWAAIRPTIEKALPALSRKQVNVLMSMADPDEAGMVAFDPIQAAAWETLRWLEEQELIAASMGEAAVAPAPAVGDDEFADY